MKHSQRNALVTALLFWAILGGFGNASASPNGEEQKGKSNSPNFLLPNQPLDTWQLIASEGFEGNFPSTGWTVRDLNHDPCQLCWDDATYWDGTVYRAYSGSWAAWPARGGTNGYSPYSNSNYANSMNTRMIYGPFDLGNASSAFVDFYLWRQIESCCDLLTLEVSHDGNSWQTIGQWNGFQDWEYETFQGQLDSYLGDNSVWVAWHFTSDSSVTYQGPWVDDIRIFKYTPGEVTVYGYFTYPDENNATVPAPLAMAYLYDQGSYGIELIAGPIYTDQNGYFQFPPVINWNYFENRRLNLYVVWEPRTIDSPSATHEVRNLAGTVYQFFSAIVVNAPDGAVNINGPVPITMPERKALWIWRDLRRSWEYVYLYGGTTFGSADPGSVIAEWQYGVNSLQWPNCPHSCFYSGGPYIFIADDSALSTDVVVHETAHHYVWNSNHWNPPVVLNHPIWGVTNSSVAWSEGWADFFVLPVNGNACFNWDNSTSCPTNNDPVNGANFEWHNRSDGLALGDAVEGRIAGALYDLLDTTNDGYDNVSNPFYQDWGILPGQPHPLNDFWIAWKNRGYEKHGSVQAIFQNGIDYDTPPSIGPLPNMTVLKNVWLNQALDLWAYSYDPESAPSQLEFWIFNVSNPNCGVSIPVHPNDRYVNIMPIQNWTGSCSVTIKALDGIYSRDSTFTVRVVEPATWTFPIFLPFIRK